MARGRKNLDFSNPQDLRATKFFKKLLAQRQQNDAGTAGCGD